MQFTNDHPRRIALFVRIKSTQWSNKLIAACVAKFRLAGCCSCAVLVTYRVKFTVEVKLNDYFEFWNNVFLVQSKRSTNMPISWTSSIQSLIDQKMIKNIWHWNSWPSKVNDLLRHSILFASRFRFHQSHGVLQWTLTTNGSER